MTLGEKGDGRVIALSRYFLKKWLMLFKDV